MILNDPRSRPAAARIGGRATLDELLRRAAQRRPDDIALPDPPNRESFTDGSPRRLTYAQADRMVSAIAGRLRRMGLHTDAIVGIQIANTVEERAHAARRAARGADRDAAAAVVAARRSGRGARPGRRQRADRERADRHDRSLRPRHACRGRDFSGPLCLRLWPRCARRGRLVRRPLHGREARSGTLARGGARRDPSPGAHLAVITWDASRRRPRSGRPQPCRADRRRPCGPARKPARARRRHALDADDVLLRRRSRSRSCHGCWSAGRLRCTSRSIRTSSSPRPARSAAIRSSFRDRWPPNSRRPVIAARRPDQRHRRLARTRTAVARAAVAHDTGTHDRRAGIRRSRPRCRLPRAGRQAGGHPVRRRVRAARAERHGRSAEIATTPPARWRCAARWCRARPSRRAPSAAACRISRSRRTASSIPAMPAARQHAMVVTGPPPGMVSVGGYRFVVRELQDLVARVEDMAERSRSCPTRSPAIGWPAPRPTVTPSGGARKARREPAAGGRVPRASAATDAHVEGNRPAPLPPSSASAPVSLTRH